MRAFLGLGSNLGNRQQYLRQAVAELTELRAVSCVFETEPVGGPPQPHYLNAVVELQTNASPRCLLEQCLTLEAMAGRQRIVRWGPRTLDVDLLWVDGQKVNEADLQVPHPRMHLRKFVVVPLLQLAPDLADRFADAANLPDKVVNLGPL